ncbi:MAG: hypothetical protein HND47_08385 [Chloroflexi bacterium]|nr:hypothetical protein [Chloroflexota bacterium]
MKTIKIVFKILVLAVLYLVCFVIASGAFVRVPADDAAAIEGAGNAGLALLIVALLNTLTLSYPILRSRWSGLKLTGAVFLAMFGAATFMSQIETAAFPAVADRLPEGMLIGIVLAGLAQAILFAPLAVWVLGKMKAKADGEPNERLQMPLKEWAWKLGIIIAAYEILYFSFGYYVAWRNPGVHTYYGGTDPGSFILQLQSVWRNTPWLFAFQALRAMLWTAIVLPVIRMMKGRPWETALAVGLLFAVLMNAQHLLPNPYMPRAVSMAHLAETASFNFIFGWIVGWLLLWKRQKADS